MYYLKYHLLLQVSPQILPYTKCTIILLNTTCHTSSITYSTGDTSSTTCSRSDTTYSTSNTTCSILNTTICLNHHLQKYLKYLIQQVILQMERCTSWGSKFSQRKLEDLLVSRQHVCLLSVHTVGKQSCFSLGETRPEDVWGRRALRASPVWL